MNDGLPLCVVDVVIVAKPAASVVPEPVAVKAPAKETDTRAPDTTFPRLSTIVTIARPALLPPPMLAVVAVIAETCMVVGPVPATWGVAMASALAALSLFEVSTAVTT